MGFAFFPPSERFQELYDEVWQQGHAFIRSHEGVPILEKFLSRLAHRQVIFVREEYHRIWEHILSRRSAAIDAGDMEQEGLTINGQPGIGKSLFLYYALGAALLARIPVVLCKHEQFCYTFDATGFKRFWFNRGEPLDLPDHTLFLVDCNWDLSSPPPLLLERSGVLVLTGSPIHETGWERMNPSDRTLFWTMDVWTRAEMHALQRTLEALTTTPQWVSTPPGKPVYTPVELLDLLGPSARQCLHFAGKPKTPAGPTADLRSCTKAGCAWVLEHLDAVLGPYPGISRRSDRPLPRAFFVDDSTDGVLALCTPQPALRLTATDTDTGAGTSASQHAHANPSRLPPSFHYAAPTLLLRQQLTASLFQLAPLTPWRTPHALAAEARARSPAFAAAAFYQPLLVQYLLDTRAGRVCHLVLDDDEHDNNNGLTESWTFRLGPGLQVRPQELDPEASPDFDLEIEDEDGCILAPRAGFTAFDVLVVSEDEDEDGHATRVTMLRAAVGPDARLLDLDASGDKEAIRGAINVLERMLPDPEAVRWCFVYAARDGERARRLAETAVARRALAEVDPRLRVGWMKVGSRSERRRAVLDALEVGKPEDGDESEEEPPAKRIRRE